MNNNDEIKKILDEPPVPEHLSPESVKNRLDAIKSQNKRRKGIHLNTTLKWCSGIAACAVLLSTGGFFAKKIQDNSNSFTTVNGNYTTAAKDYKQVYKYMKKYMKTIEYDYCEEAVDGAVYDYEYEAEGTIEEDGALNKDMGADSEISKLYNQEFGVLEGDIVQTDGKKIYSVNENNEIPCIHITETDGKTFTSSNTVCLLDYLPETVEYGYIRSMYLENNKLIVALDTDESKNESFFNRTHVLVFEAGEELKFLGDYSQDGDYSDIRLMEDGTLYIMSNYNWARFYDDRNYDECIPAYYMDEEKCMASPDDILLPEDNPSYDIDCIFGSSFKNIGSINVFSDSPSTVIDFKSLAGFSGQLYCSLDNIYIASSYWENGGYTTDFTRINIDNGNIVPEASINVNGNVKDQFSMSEYNGFFRAAVSREFNESNDNAVYIFDMAFNKIGEIGGFGKDETIQSASFQGNLAYIVTFKKTDPLYAIDLSDPYSPVILDEHKITGYSSYMQQWSDNLLLGFGIDCDEDGNELGLKLVMFDNSDPNNLIEKSVATIHSTDVDSYNFAVRDRNWIYSAAEHDRKALFLSPEKNLIAVPFTSFNSTGFVFYSYDNNSFKEKDIIYSKNNVKRALYIGNTIFIIGDYEMIAVDMETMSENDYIYF